MLFWRANTDDRHRPKLLSFCQDFDYLEHFVFVGDRFCFQPTQLLIRHVQWNELPIRRFHGASFAVESVGVAVLVHFGGLGEHDLLVQPWRVFHAPNDDFT